MMKTGLRMYTLIMAIASLSFCCSGNKATEGSAEETYIVDINKATNDISLVFSQIDVLTLQENEDNLIGEVNKIVISDQYIYVLDSWKSKALFVFDKDGAFIRAFDALGTGAGEFVSPDDFQIDNDLRQIIILDKNSRKLLFYDLDGDFIRDIKLDYFVNSFILYQDDKIILDRGNYISDNTDEYLAIISKKEGKTLQTLFPRDKVLENMTFSPFNPLTKISDTILYLPPMNSAVYEVHQDLYKQKYAFNFGRLWPNNEELEKLKDQHPMDIVKTLTKKGYVLFPNFLENRKHICLNFTVDNKKIVAFFDKKNKKNIVVNWESDQNDDLSLPITADENKFICAKYSEQSPVKLLFLTLADF